MDRRAAFFALASLVCLLLAPVAEARFRTLTIGVAITYALLALASYLDARSRRHPSISADRASRVRSSDAQRAHEDDRSTDG